MRILNYLDDWLILAQSEAELIAHRTVLLSHLDSLGLTVNWTKSSLVPNQSTSFLGLDLDTVAMTARLSPRVHAAFDAWPRPSSRAAPHLSRHFRGCWVVWHQLQQYFS